MTLIAASHTEQRPKRREDGHATLAKEYDAEGYGMKDKAEEMRIQMHERRANRPREQQRSSQTARTPPPI